LHARGDIDIRTVEEFTEALSYSTARHDQIVVDLTQVRFLCTQGVEALDNHVGAVAALVVSSRNPIAPVLRAGGLVLQP
jgi:anti-anti-sigma factor